MTSEQPDRSVVAWRDFCASLADAGDLLLTEPALSNPMVMAEGVRALSRYATLALESVLESADPDRPRFVDLQTPIRKFMGDNPDQTYRTATIGGECAYEIEGCMEGAIAVEVSVYGGGGFMTGGRRLVAFVDDMTLDIDAEGRFALRLSSAEDADLRLEPDASSVLIRTYFTDLGDRLLHSMPTIRRVPAAEPAPRIDDEWTEAHLGLAALFVSGAFGWWMDLKRQQSDPALVNTFPPMRDDGDLLTPANVRYRSGYFRLGPDEAWVIEIAPGGEADYWNVVLMSIWGETVDWRERPASVNHANAVAEADGTVRIVVAHRDPGLPNWLDTAGNPEGSVALRWFRSTGELPDVETRLVPVDDLTTSRD